MNVFFSSCWCGELTPEVCPNILDTPRTRQTNVIKVIMKVTNKMQLYRLTDFSLSALHVSGDISPIIRSTWLYLQYLVVLAKVAAGWCFGWVEFKLIQDTSRQQLGCVLPDTVNTVKCSWWWAKTSPEICRADKEKSINLYSCILLVTFIIVSRCTDSWTSSHQSNYHA